VNTAEKITLAGRFTVRWKYDPGLGGLVLEINEIQGEDWVEPEMPRSNISNKGVQTLMEARYMNDAQPAKLAGQTRHGTLAGRHLAMLAHTRRSR